MPRMILEPGPAGADVYSRFQQAEEGGEEWARAAISCLRVLVVDDNKDAADSMCLLAEIWGYQVERAYDGFAALERISASQPDVMLLDLAMPKMDGCRLAREIRGQPIFRDALLIAITGYTGPEYRLLCAKAGFDHFLIKPVDPLTIKKLLVQRDGLRAPGSQLSPKFRPACIRTESVSTLACCRAAIDAAKEDRCFDSFLKPYPEALVE